MSVSWTIHAKDSDVDISGLELLMSLIEHSMKAERPPHEEMVRVLIEYLQAQTVLAKCTPQQLALIAFDAGYFYRVFLEKNKVTTQVQNESEHRD